MTDAENITCGTPPRSYDDLTFEQKSEVFTLDSLAAVARGKPFESAVWMFTASEALFGKLIKITYSLTPEGQAKLDAAIAKVSDEHRAAFLAEGLKAKFLNEPGATS